MRVRVVVLCTVTLPSVAFIADQTAAFVFIAGAMLVISLLTSLSLFVYKFYWIFCLDSSELITTVSTHKTMKAGGANAFAEG